ncbi:PKD domain-containing protein [Neobacillus pocheonensis]|uniref:hypothetical protein n=1 Tax=Neobacillus pocheonensis TaxID=363869 RepID=UPI003D26BA48
MKKFVRTVFMTILILLVTFSSVYATPKPNTETDVVVDNVPPITSFGMTKKKKIDLVLNLDNTQYSLSTVQAKANSILTPALAANNIDARIQVNPSTKKKDSKFYYMVSTGECASYYGYGGCSSWYNKVASYDYATGETKVYDGTRLVNDYGDTYAGFKGVSIGPNNKMYYIALKEYGTGMTSMLYEYDMSTQTERKIMDNAYNAFGLAGGVSMIAGSDGNVYVTGYSLAGQSTTGKLIVVYPQTSTYSVIWTSTGNGDSPSNLRDTVDGIYYKYLNNVYLYKYSTGYPSIVRTLSNSIHYDYFIDASADGSVLYSYYGQVYQQSSVTYGGPFGSGTLGGSFSSNTKVTPYKLSRNTGMAYIWCGYLGNSYQNSCQPTVTQQNDLYVKINMRNQSATILSNGANDIPDTYTFDDKAVLRYQEPYQELERYQYFDHWEPTGEYSPDYDDGCGCYPPLYDPVYLWGERWVTKYRDFFKVFDDLTGTILVDRIPIEALGDSPKFLIGKSVGNGAPMGVTMTAKPNMADDFSINVPLANAGWRDGAARYFADISDNYIGELTQKSKRASILSKLITNSVNFIGLGNGKNQSQYLTLISQNNNNGAYFDNSNLDAALNNLVNMIVTKANNDSIVSTYLLLNDCVDYQVRYSDRESDPKNAERWLITHEPNFFENNQGIISTSGQYVSSPISCFDKVGKYIVQYQAQDNPKNDWRFTNFWYWSLDNKSKMIIYVNRKPIALFTATSDNGGNVTIRDYSYDLDHLSQLNRGIQEWQWSWRQVESTTWNSGQPTSIDPNDVYLIQLKVRDMENNWSDPFVQAIGGGNLPPVAIFETNPSSAYLYGTFTLTDRSYDPAGLAITNRTWSVIKNGTQIYSGATTPSVDNLRNWASGSGIDPKGNYSITEVVQNAVGLWSAPYTQIQELAVHGPAPSFTVTDPNTRDQQVIITNTTPNPDIDGSPVSYHWYAIKDGASTFDLGTATNPTFTFKSLGLGKNAVSPNWQIKLVATNGNGVSASTMKPVSVINQKPVATASGPTSGFINMSYTYTSGAYDPDSEDGSSLQYVFSLTAPSGQRQQFSTSTITPFFSEGGNYTLEHYVVDQLGAKSEVFTMNIYINPYVGPIPGFTVSPNPATRIDTVNVISKASDPNKGGYITSYAYYLTPPGGSEYQSSTSKDWTFRPNILGLWGMRQVVCNNHSLCAQATGSLNVVNLSPSVTLTNPSGPDINNPSANTPPFTATWNYSDPEKDVQTKYQLKIYRADNNALIQDTGIVSSSATSFYIPNGLLTSGLTYYMTIQTWDAFNAPSNVDVKYFLTNRPPVADFTVSPVPAFEGDTVTLTNTSWDPDGDAVTSSWTVTNPNGVTTTATTTNVVIPGSIKGIYTATLTVTDPYGLSDTITKTFAVSDLSIIGFVEHTARYEELRQAYNREVSGDPEYPRTADMFVAGEAFMLRANTTDTGTSSTKATSVRVTRSPFPFAVNLSSGNQINWSGRMVDNDYNEKLTDGNYTFRFTATWSNGHTESVDVLIKIKGDTTLYFNPARRETNE